jgi:CheY-like chemotaxis protein
MPKTIFLADDDLDDSELFIECVHEIDPTVVCYCATNGQEALDTLGQIDLPDIIFMDINMPIMNGWQCLAEIKENKKLKAIPVIMYSTSSHQKDIDRAFDLGALCFLIKPYEFKDLKEALMAVIASLNGESFKTLHHLKVKNLSCPDLDIPKAVENANH